jgi:PAS domain S-box-containing protein
VNLIRIAQDIMLMFKKRTVEAGLLADLQGKLAAINKWQAVVEFDLQGHILTANENFLELFGYRLEEVKGHSYSMFVDPLHRGSDEYRLFWEKLRRGEYETGQYERLGNGGREAWVQASYYPILDAQGKPYKVVEFASDVTAQVHLTQQMINVVVETQDVIKFANGGDWSRRVGTASASGDVLKMAEAINLLLDNNSGDSYQGTLPVCEPPAAGSAIAVERRAAVRPWNGRVKPASQALAGGTDAGWIEY